MKVIALQAENIKRLSAVEITPQGPVVVVGGKNAAGKSSVLDSIAYALGGKALLPSEPLRRGEKSGQVTVELDGDEGRKIPGLKVTRTFTDTQTTSLRVATADGMKPASPQTLLDSLCGRIAFDPLEFTRMPPAKQVETLRELVGLDFSTHDAVRLHLYDDRTQVNREAKAVKVRLDSAPREDDAPAEEISVAALVEQLEEAQAVNRAEHAAGTKAREREQDIVRLARDTSQAVGRVESAKQVLAEAERELTEFCEVRKVYETDAKQLKVETDAMPTVDCQPLHNRIAESETLNAKFRNHQEHKRLAGEHKQLVAKADGLTEQLATLDAEKQTAMESAQWPVDGLGFGEDGITFGGLAFEQASSAEQLRVAVAIGLALNPTLRVLLIRDGSLLDEDNLRMLAEMAAGADAQVWLERVGEDGECAVVIKDGTVKQMED